MRFFTSLLSFVFVVLRLLVVAAPFLLNYFPDVLPHYDFLKLSNRGLLIFIYCPVAALLMFLPELWKAAPSGVQPGEFVAGEVESEDNHFDFMTPGTHEYNRFHQGDDLDMLNPPKTR